MTNDANHRMLRDKESAVDLDGGIGIEAAGLAWLMIRTKELLVIFKDRTP